MPDVSIPQRGVRVVQIGGKKYLCARLSNAEEVPSGEYEVRAIELVRGSDGSVKPEAFLCFVQFTWSF